MDSDPDVDEGKEFETRAVDAGLQSAIDDAKNASNTFVGKLKNWVNDPKAPLSQFKKLEVVDSVMANRFAVLTLRQIAKVSKGLFVGDLSQRGLQGGVDTLENQDLIEAYAKLQQQMQTDRNERSTKAADTADELTKFAHDFPKEADLLFRTMHDSTIEGTDPSKEKFVVAGDVINKRRNELLLEVDRIEQAAFKTKEAEFKKLNDEIELLEDSSKKEDVARVKVLEKESRELKGQVLTGKKKQIDNLKREARELKEELNMEPSRKKAYIALRKQWLEITAMEGGSKAADLYTRMRDDYKDSQDAYHRSMTQKITRNVEDPIKRAQMIKRAEFYFQFNTLKAPYFPLHRTGKYFVRAENKITKEKVFLMQESQEEMNKVKQNIEKMGKYNILEANKFIDKDFANDGASLSFLQDLESLVDGMDNEDGQKADLKDSIYQLYLTHSPDRSLRRSLLHRKGVKGFSQDAVRAYADTMMKSAYQLSKLEHGDDLAEIIKGIESIAQEKGKGDPESGELLDAKQSVLASTIANEMKKRHAHVLTPEPTPIASKVTAMGFVYFLGISPAAALINLTQTVAVALPILTSKFTDSQTGGLKGASRELMKAVKMVRPHKDPKTGKWEISIPSKNLNSQERDAMKAWRLSGLIDITRAHDLTGIAETGSTDYNATYHKAMDKVSWFYHYAEVVNRQTTALAAYRLARQGDKNHAEATELAANITWDSHFDYSNANRARVMQGGTAKVMFQFRQYSQQITFHMMHNLIRMYKKKFKGDQSISAEEYRESKVQLLGTLGATGLMGGANAMPAVWLAYMAAEIFNGDDLDEGEEPLDAKAATYDYLAKVMGKDAADKAIYGLFGAGVSSRISLGNLWFSFREHQLKQEKLWETTALTLAGPVMGGLASTSIRGASDIMDGDYQKGMERLVPKAVRDVSKGLRYATEGETNYKGDVIKSSEDFQWWQPALTALGISDADVMKRYEENASIKNLEMNIKRQRSALMTEYYRALLDGDLGDRREVTERIKIFNKTIPRYPISSKSLRASIRSKQRSAQRNTKGLELSTKLEYLADRYDWVE